MQSVGKIMEEMLDQMGIKRRIKESETLLIWDDTVGERIAGVTVVEKIHNGTVFVKVKNDSWRNELFCNKVSIIHKLNEKLGGRIVKEIKFI